VKKKLSLCVAIVLFGIFGLSKLTSAELSEQEAGRVRIICERIKTGNEITRGNPLMQYCARFVAPEDFQFVLRKTREELNGQSVVRDIQLNPDEHCFAISDLHGELDAVVTAFERVNLSNPKNHIVNLGDAVDRGLNSMASIIYLLGMQLLYPRQVINQLGDHELEPHEFENELLRKGYSQEVAQGLVSDFLDTVRFLPWITICKGSEGKGSAYLAHGGFGEDTDLNAFRDFKAPIAFPDNIYQPQHPVVNVIWSDPVSSETDSSFMFAKNDSRGEGSLFGKQGLIYLCRHFGITTVLRGHSHSVPEQTGFYLNLSTGFYLNLSTGFYLNPPRCITVISSPRVFSRNPAYGIGIETIFAVDASMAVLGSDMEITRVQLCADFINSMSEEEKADWIRIRTAEKYAFETNTLIERFLQALKNPRVRQEDIEGYIKVLRTLDGERISAIETRYRADFGLNMGVNVLKDCLDQIELENKNLMVEAESTLWGECQPLIADFDRRMAEAEADRARAEEASRIEVARIPDGEDPRSGAAPPDQELPNIDGGSPSAVEEQQPVEIQEPEIKPEPAKKPAPKPKPVRRPVPKPEPARKPAPARRAAPKPEPEWKKYKFEEQVAMNWAQRLRHGHIKKMLEKNN